MNSKHTPPRMLGGWFGKHTDDKYTETSRTIGQQTYPAGSNQTIANTAIPNSMYLLQAATSGVFVCCCCMLLCAAGKNWQQSEAAHEARVAVELGLRPGEQGLGGV